MTKKLYYKAGAAISAASLLATTFTSPLMASVIGTGVNDTTGADSDNDVVLNVDTNTFVDQSNKGHVLNEINLNANTGGNEANKNTGEGHIQTGDVATGVGVANSLNTNVADIDGCGGCDMDLYGSNNKTGADSDNDVKIDFDKVNRLEQNNTANIRNKINQQLNTGDNQANKNTGMGDISTGDVDSVSLVENQANQNMADVDSGDGVAFLTATNDTTGADSDNDAKVDVDLNNWMVQNNRASILNDASVKANTGWNQASKNTGLGDVATGDVDTGIGFQTAANENYLAFDGCCDVELGVGNVKTGADSDNDSKADLDSDNTVFQGNCTGEGPQAVGSLFDRVFGDHHHHRCGITNLVYGDLNTGDNQTNKNTADGILSGDVEAAVEVASEENQNVIGSDWDMMDVEFGGLLSDGWYWLFS